MLSVNTLSLRFGTLADKVRRRVRLSLHGEHPRHYFDLNDRAAINHLLAEADLPALETTPHSLAFTAGNLERGEKVYELRADVRSAIPLALTPAQRGVFLRWYLSLGGRQDTDATLPDLLRALFEQDATPDRGLVASYLVHPIWQERFPNALTPAGWEPFKAWIASEFGAVGRWLRRAKLPAKYTQEHDSRHGVNVIGLFRYTSGLQQAANGVLDALDAAGVPVEVRDVPMPHHRDGRRRTGFDGRERFPVTILNTGLDMPVSEAYRLAGLHRWPGVYRVAVWWWELEQLPADWLDRGRDVDEIWAPTAFIAEALRPLGKPVYPMLPSVRRPEFTPKSKAYFGLSLTKFTFLFVFDMNSRLPRKNPLSLIRAFRKAFRPSEPVELVVKVGPQEKYYPEWWAALRAASRDNGVTLIDRSLSRGDLLALMNAADAYVSLHRSEGFGLTMAEAMLLGKPTIATGYSGNLDFMSPDTSYLVRYDRAAIEDDTPPYPKGCVWAEPSVDHAAELMRQVYDDRAGAEIVARRGRDAVASLLSREAAGRRIAGRLAEINRT